MNFKLIQSVFITASLFCSGAWALSGTGGTPLGGMGTGYVLYSGDKFAVSGKMPPAGADHSQGTAEKVITSSGFHILAGTTAKSPAKATSEDAKCPLQTCDFGTIGGVKFNLNAFGPYLPGGSDQNFKLALSPLALFDMTAVNSGTAAVDVAVALEFANGGLLGGANSGTVETGNKAISFSGTDNAYLAVDCDGTTPTFTAGAVGTFATDGKLANAAGNLVAAKCSVPAGATVHFKFVLAWYRDYESEDYYYHNYYTSSKDVADTGIAKFDAIRNGITSFVSRVMASNFPDWYKDRLLNNTYPLVHNSVCAKDGRVAFWEGKYGIIGTLDQGQHAAVFYTFNWPSVEWHELQFWAKSARSNGQIHHDVNQGVEKFTPGSSANNRHMLPWTNTDHADYWWFPNTETWADLNCMFIFKAYELMLATGDKDSLKIYWPAIKKTALHLINDQCKTGSKLPLDCHSTYDQKDNGTFGFTPIYCGSIALPAYLAVAELAKMAGDDATATQFMDQFKGGKAEFKQKYGSDNTFGASGRFAEGHIAGYSWANYLCLEPVMDEDFITGTCTKMREKQKSGIRANGEWIFYDVDHYGGSEIAINQPDAAMVIHQQDYDAYYKNNPSQVHWQSLQVSSGYTGHDSYMTAPMVWHSYFQFCGYMIDNAFQRLWIRPRVPSDMKGKITKALLMNPKALGTLNYDETADATTGKTQDMTIQYDAPVTVKEIVLKNNTGVEKPFVVIAGVNQTSVTTETKGIEKNIRVALATPLQIGTGGVNIQVYSKEPPPVGIAGVVKSVGICPLAFSAYRITAQQPVRFSVAASGPVTMELLSLSGARIGVIMRQNCSAGEQAFVWDGKTVDGKQVGSVFAVLRLTSPNGTVTKTVMTSR